MLMSSQGSSETATTSWKLQRCVVRKITISTTNCVRAHRTADETFWAASDTIISIFQGWLSNLLPPLVSVSSMAMQEFDV